MLLELHVKNLAVLAGASVELGEGLNVLTGETGAGKSIIVDSLLLLTGARAAAELIRTGAEALTVTGVFRPAGKSWRQVVEDAGVEIDGPELVVRREISREGRNRAYVNDQPATVRLLGSLAPHLLRIYGQREEMGLVDPDLQRIWLDKSGGTEAEGLLRRTEATYEEWHRLAARLERLTGERRALEQRIDFLRFQASEIDAAALVAGEDEELRTERAVLRNREQITRALGGAFELLFEEEGAAVERLGRSQALLGEIAEWEPQAGEWTAELEEARIRVDELAATLRRRLESLEADPQRLNEVEDRLAVVERLCRKYGSGAAEVLEKRRRIAEELADLESDVADRGDLEARVETALSAYRESAVELSAARTGWGEALARGMRDELEELGLGKARLAVALERRPRADSPLRLAPAARASGGGNDAEGVDFGPHGFDQVVFQFAPNPGEETRPLGRIASGGELSRIYLALQLAVQAREKAVAAAPVNPTLVFDEVDTGISGAQAAGLGRKLQRLASRAQILAVTHLPQVASHADCHFRVAKAVRDERTHVEVRRLDDEERVREVARLLAGEKITDVAAKNARELISRAARKRR